MLLEHTLFLEDTLVYGMCFLYFCLVFLFEEIRISWPGKRFPTSDGIRPVMVAVAAAVAVAVAAGAVVAAVVAVVVVVVVAVVVVVVVVVVVAAAAAAAAMVVPFFIFILHFTAYFCKHIAVLYQDYNKTITLCAL
jgi:O-antigen ligase